ncbi:hypothetical protein [Saccharibacter floricola]|uniref:DUF2125 domain-containing protein n=1 Tax=Saccharibacter floricola DSM 15669 TaxID=1123227 RepID=A0ABQ0NVY8_9PROT|nr:hypothetical protein [Saccharibacter floricola]GBQ04675.1 hypothetical protein AA15669_0086 [Saccharibacter floricola DSM 15669]
MTHTSLFSYPDASLPEAQRGVTKRMMSRLSYMVGALSCVGMFGVLSPLASAKTLPPLSEACFTYTPGHAKDGSHTLASTDFRAVLPGTGLSLRIASTQLTDHSHHLDASALERINAAAAYAALSALNHGVSDACQGMPIPETDEVKGATPEAHWSIATLSRTGKTDITVKNIHLSVLTTSPGIHVKFDAIGLPTDHPLLPSKGSGDLTFYPAATPPYHVDLHSLRNTIGKSEIEGKGTLWVAPGVQNLKGTLHLSISHIGALIQRVSTVAPVSVTAGLSVARMMSNTEGADMSGWDIQLNDGKAVVNGISIPLPKH